ncbi:MAG: hypothetical protein IT308_04650 [Anaerolineaceae bacterium]|nr:hypothetical protein [Anaerolineaceae bacterium]
MSIFCTECGAVLNKSANCQAIFESLLALEFTDPTYGEVHFLTAACFMIQHWRYSNEALAWIQTKLKEYLENEMTNEQLRKLAIEDVRNIARTWKVLRPTESPPLPKIKWQMTITDVASKYGDAESYRALIRQWALLTMRQMTTSGAP